MCERKIDQQSKEDFLFVYIHRARQLRYKIRKKTSSSHFNVYENKVKKKRQHLKTSASRAEQRSRWMRYEAAMPQWSYIVGEHDHQETEGISAISSI